MYRYQDEEGQHLHTLDEQPLLGTSTICRIISKPLTWWAAGCAVAVFGWTKKKDEDGRWVPRARRIAAVQSKFEMLKSITVDAFLDLLDDAYKAHDQVKRTAATQGTDRHSSLEDYVKACLAEDGVPKPVSDFLPGTYASEVEEFIVWSLAEVKRFLWAETNCFSKELWVGGIADIGMELKNGTICAGDHKSSKEAYFDQFIQIAGYDIQLTENGGYDSNGNKVFDLPGPITAYVVFPFRSVPFKPQFEYDVEGYKEAFRSAAKLYKLQQLFSKSN